MTAILGNSSSTGDLGLSAEVRNGFGVVATILNGASLWGLLSVLALQLIWGAHRRFCFARIVMAMTVYVLLAVLGFTGLVLRRSLHVTGLEHGKDACPFSALLVAGLFGQLYMETWLLVASIYQVLRMAPITERHHVAEYSIIRLSGIVVLIVLVSSMVACSSACKDCTTWMCGATCVHVLLDALAAWLALCAIPLVLLFIFLFVVRKRNEDWQQRWEKYAGELDEHQFARKCDLIRLEQREVAAVIRPIRLYPPVFMLLFTGVLMLTAANVSQEVDSQPRLLVEQVAMLLISVKPLVFLRQCFLYEDLRPIRKLRSVRQRIQNRRKPHARIRSGLMVQSIFPGTRVCEDDEDDEKQDAGSTDTPPKRHASCHYRLMEDLMGDDDADESENVPPSVAGGMPTDRAEASV